MNTRKPFLKLIGPLACACLIATGVPAFGQVALSPAASEAPELERHDTLAAGPSGPGFGVLFEETIRDFGRLRSKETVAWLGLGAVAATLAHSVDRSTSNGLSSARGLDATFGPGKDLGGARVQFGSALATFLVGKATHSAKISQVGADLFGAQIVSQALTAGIKLSVRRTRPDGTGFSFPSGHTATSFASATVLQRHFGWKVGVPAYGLAAYVATSRIQEKRHFLSDVAFGAAIGILAGRSVTVGRGDAQFAVAPAVAAGGGGISFTWVGRR